MLLKSLVAVLSLLTASATLAGDADRFNFRHGAEKLGAVVSGEDDGRFAWSAGDSLSALYDSTLPSSRLSIPLQRSLTGADTFALEVEFEMLAVDGGPDDFMQLAFGLVNSATTGLNRTGTSVPPPIYFIDDSDTYDQIEFAYFPNETFFGGPFLQPAVFGAEVGSPFDNFAASFGPSADLGDNGPDQLSAWPVGRRVLVRLVHDACAETLTTRVFDAASGDELDFGLEPVDLSFLNATGTFTVDSFAISLHEDAADFDPSSRSLFADLRFHSAGLEQADAASAELKPSALNAAAQGAATLRITGGAAAWLGLDEATLVSASGEVSVVSLKTTGAGLSARIEREFAADGPLTLEVGGCVVPVAGPTRIKGS